MRQLTLSFLNLRSTKLSTLRKVARIPKPMILETERLTLRPITLDDKNDVFDYRSDSQTNKYQGWIPTSVSDVEVFIRKSANQINVPQTWFQFVIVEKNTQKIIGDLGINFFDFENYQAEIGCTLNRDFQNKGYATESLTRVIDYLFGALKKHRIITSLDPNNKNSIRLVERLGFRKEAHFVESLFLNNTWVDDLIYAMLKREWEVVNEL